MHSSSECKLAAYFGKLLAKLVLTELIYSFDPKVINLN